MSPIGYSLNAEILLHLHLLKPSSNIEARADFSRTPFVYKIPAVRFLIPERTLLDLKKYPQQADFL